MCVRAARRSNWRRRASARLEFFRFQITLCGGRYLARWTCDGDCATCGKWTVDVPCSLGKNCFKHYARRASGQQTRNWWKFAVRFVYGRAVFFARECRQRFELFIFCKWLLTPSVHPVMNYTNLQTNALTKKLAKKFALKIRIIPRY